MAILTLLSAAVPNAWGGPPLVHPDADVIGVALEQQLERALEIGRWSTHRLTLHDYASLGIDAASGESLLATRLHIARGEPAGSGDGTLANPYLAGDDGRELGALLSSIFSGTSGPFAVYIDSAIDTSTAPTPPSVDDILANGADPVHLIAWDRSGTDPNRRVVIDAFRPVSAQIDTRAQWIPGANAGEFSVMLEQSGPVGALRIGPATQHAISDDLLFHKPIDDLDGSSIGQHRYHYDPASRVLTVRLADGGDPSELDLRVSRSTLSFLQVATDRFYQRGLRISGYNAAPPNQTYNQRFLSGADRLYLIANSAWDFAFRHAAGLAGGGGAEAQSQRLITIDCEYGFGDGSSGFTSSVAYAPGGGQHAVEIGPTFVGGTDRREAALAQFMHTSGVDTARSFITIDSDIDCEHASLRWGAHDDRDTTDPVYSLLVACRMRNLQLDSRATQIPFDTMAQAYCDAEVGFTTHLTPFSGVQAAPIRIRTEAYRSRFRLTGPFSLGANAFRTLYHRAGVNTLAATPASLAFDESVLDLSGMAFTDGPAMTIWRSVESLESIAAAQGPLCSLRDSVLRAPAQGGFAWFHNATRDTPGWSAATDFTGSAFVGDWPEDQVPVGALTYTEAAWAALDPATTVPPGLVYPWLIDQAQALDVEPVKIRARFDGNSRRIVALPNKHGSSGRCHMGVAVVPAGGAPSQAALLAGEIGTIDPAVGGVVDLTGDGDVYLYTRDMATPTAVAPVLAGSLGAPEDLNADGVTDGADLGLLLGAWGACAAPCDADLNADGVVDGADLGLLLGAWN